jgi:hypothetical protein
MVVENQEIIIESEILSPSTLKSLLEDQRDWIESGVFLSLRESAFQVRGLDSTVLVALVGVTGTALDALISGILQILKEKHTGKIILQGRNGQKIEVPATMPFECIEKLIRKTSDLERIKVEVE